MTTPGGLEQQLAELDDLKARGIITDAEYVHRRQALVGGGPAQQPRPAGSPNFAVAPAKQGRGVVKTAAIGFGVLVLAVVVLGVLAAAIGGGGEDEEAASAPQLGSPSTGAGNGAATIAAIGQPVRLEKDGWLITVTDVRAVPTVKGLLGDKQALGTYLIVDVTMENLGKSARELGGDRFEIRDSQGRQYKYYSEGTIGNGRGEISSKINPGLSGRGTIVYDVPKDAQGLILETVGKGRIALGDAPQ